MDPLLLGMIKKAGKPTDAQVSSAVSSYLAENPVQAYDDTEIQASVDDLGVRKASYYNTVSDMKSDTSLTAGVYVCTFGYYTAEDGGGATYRIQEDDSSHIREELNNGLYAVLVTNDIVNILQIGGKANDNTFDNTTAINRAIVNSNISGLYFPTGRYYINHKITLNRKFVMLGQTLPVRPNYTQDTTTHTTSIVIDGSILDFSNSEVTDDYCIDASSYHIKNFSNLSIISSAFEVYEDRAKTPNGNRDSGDVFTVVTKTTNQSGLKLGKYGSEIKDCQFSGFSGNALFVSQYEKVKNTEFYMCNTGVYINGPDCEVHHIRLVQCATGIEVAQYNSLINMSNIRMDSISEIGIKFNAGCNNCTINSITIDYSMYSGIMLDNYCKYITINDYQCRSGVYYAGYALSEVPSDDYYKCSNITLKSCQYCNINGIKSSQYNVTDSSSDTINAPCIPVSMYGSNENNNIVFYDEEDTTGKYIESNKIFDLLHSFSGNSLRTVIKKAGHSYELGIITQGSYGSTYETDVIRCNGVFLYTTSTSRDITAYANVGDKRFNGETFLTYTGSTWV